MHSVCIYFKHVLKIVLRLDEWLIHIYFLSLLKPETLENQMFSDVFRGWCRKEIMTWNGLKFFKKVADIGQAIASQNM